MAITSFEEVEAAVGALQYKPGDQISFDRLSIGGHLTGTNGNQVFGFIPTAKPLVGVANAQFVNPDNIELRLRYPSGGYFWDESIGLANESGEQVTLAPQADGLIFSFNWPGGFLTPAMDAKSNCPVSIEMLRPCIQLS